MQYCEIKNTLDTELYSCKEWCSKSGESTATFKDWGVHFQLYPGCSIWISALILWFSTSHTSQSIIGSRERIFFFFLTCTCKTFQFCWFPQLIVRLTKIAHIRVWNQFRQGNHTNYRKLGEIYTSWAVHFVVRQGIREETQQCGWRHIMQVQKNPCSHTS